MCEMTQRVARAIFYSKLLQPARGAWDEENPNATQAHCVAAARDAINAMAIPTDDMLFAADGLRVVNKGVRIEPNAASVWQVMIDEAQK